MKGKDYWVIIKNDKFYAIEDTWEDKPKIKDGEVVGIGYFKNPVDAIDYFKYLLGV